jgi:NADH-quinone oxidoreductase subunit K
MEPTLTHYLVMAALLMGAGIGTLVLRRGALGKLLGIELMMAAAGLNWAAFAAYGPTNNVEGEMLVLVSIVIGAAQGALAVAIVVNYYRGGNKVAELSG